ncbi:MAG: amidohydrolase, partial [Pyrinomonadaceae bacterium]
VEAQEKRLDQMIERELPSLVTTYKTLHAAPELSHHEEHTSTLFAKELREFGYEVTERFGKYNRSDWTSYGVVAVMKNGAGPVVLVRTDMDALPVEETTELPYASKVKTKNEAGQDVSVMHACGHDIHITSLLGTAKMLKEMKEQWHGTLVLIGQPAEETVHGAEAMLAGGLYSQFPKPDYAIALHDSADLGAGKVGYTPGYGLASSTSVDITIRGLGGHGSKPEATKDPIVVAAQLILALQTIISRENSPLDPAVVTVGSIHGGAKNNIIPDEVNLLLTVRAYKEEVRQKIIASIERITNGIAQAAGIPPDRAPVFNLKKEFTPATYNNPELTERLAKVFVNALGADNVVQTPPAMASEDFGYYGLENHQIPTTIFWLGAVDQAMIAKSKQTGIPLPSLHSSRFAPVPESTIRTG